MQRIPVTDFLAAAAVGAPVLDVRSPGEYAHAHLPGATSFPLFTDADRARIGTAYKQQSRAEAIKIGLDAFGPHMRAMVEKAEQLHSKQLLVHCWRGGMRSNAVAWLLDLYGFEVALLEGGYKAYRQWVISHWQGVHLRVLCGNTGSGKTDILLALAAAGAPVIDLEGLAQHKGSAFGGLDNIAQPTQEMFENLLAANISQARARFPGKPIWIEDESQRIGHVNIPTPFFRGWGSAEGVFLDVPFEDRLARVVAGYGSYPTESLVNAIIRIKKRLGPLETKTTIAHLIEGNIPEAFRILLHYYDKHYYPANATARPRMPAGGMTPDELATVLIQQYP